ncbi:hypothetical protein IWX92DRAFT_375199 [Phyllosticta citricarpa]
MALRAVSSSPSTLLGSFPPLLLPLVLAKFKLHPLPTYLTTQTSPTRRVAHFLPRHESTIMSKSSRPPYVRACKQATRPPSYRQPCLPCLSIHLACSALLCSVPLPRASAGCHL